MKLHKIIMGMIMIPASIIQASAPAQAQAQPLSLYSKPHASDSPLVQAIKQRINRRLESGLQSLPWVTESNEELVQEQLNDSLSFRRRASCSQEDAKRNDSYIAEREKILSTIAFLRNQLPAVNALITSDAGVNQASEQNYKRTPIMLASAYCDLPVVESLLARPDVDVLGEDATGQTARFLALRTSFSIDSGNYKDDCSSIRKLLKKRGIWQQRKKELGPNFEQRFVDQASARLVAQDVLSSRKETEEQFLPIDLSNIVGEYIVPQQGLQRFDQPDQDFDMSINPASDQAESSSVPVPTEEN